MEKDTIITLDDNTKYVLMDETIKDNSKYFFAIKLDKKDNPTTEYEIFEVEKDGKDTYMNTLEEGEFKEAILLEFTHKYIKEIEETN